MTGWRIGIRLSYSLSIEDMTEALDRIRKFVMKISINQAAKYEGQQVTIGCWLLQKRGSGKIQFLQLRDGTGFHAGSMLS